MLILERDGTVLVVQPGATAPDPTPFLQLTTVSTSDERGALGITLDPGFASNGFFYVMYTHSSLRNRVARFTAAGNVAGVGSETVLWENDVDAAIYHQGGGLQFGSDGTLYVSVGDNLDRASVQDLRSYNGKILRIRTDGSVPADNPFNDGAGPNRDAIWALGLRNPFRFAIDAVSGRMYVADVGETSTEEVNLGVRGANYGWPTCEGPCSQAGLTDPIFSYLHGGRDASITGGFVFRGSSFGSGYDGSYFYADYAQNWIRRLTFDAAGNVVDSRAFVPLDGSSDGPYGDPVYLTQGPDGALYYVDIGPIGSANGGSIRRVRNTNADQPPLVRATASPTAGPAPLSVTFSSAGTTDPEGRALTFRWDFGDGTISTAPNPVHAYGTAGPYTARLAVSDGTNTSLSQPLSITVGSPPTPTILAPSAGATFRAGDVISYSGRATDAEDGTLPGSALAWTVVFHHEGHEHPGPGGTTGASGSFAVPTSGHDFTGTTSYELILTATDSTGLSRSTSITLTPEKVQLTIASTPPGLTVLVDDLPHATPYTFDTLIGFRHTLDATGPQTLGAARYAFSSWSDGGAKVHAIIVPTTDRTITASYAETVATGLVAAYSFDEGSGTSAADVSGNGNRGTVSGAAWAGAGKFSGALSFDGLDDIVTVPHSASLLLTTGMTLSAWVNPSVVTGSWRTVVFKERTGGMTYALYANNGSNRPVGQIFANGAERDSQGGATLPANAWSHLATTFDGTSLKLFVNGVQAGSLTSSGSIVTSTGSLRIGGNSIWAEWFRGLVDDVRIYSRALSAQEIQADMARPAP
jgi:glucose/arabinose dehydrogenase/PKD repeat protein